MRFAGTRGITEPGSSVASTTLVVPALLPPLTAGATYWGPGDMYRFLVTGEETAAPTSRRRRPSRRAAARPRYGMEFLVS